MSNKKYSLKLIPVAHELISNMRAFFQTNNARLNHLDEEPLRAELFGSEQMERYGKALAEAHKLYTGPGTDHLLERLADNEIILNETHKLLTDLIKGNNQIAPAGEWLIDNFYIIEEHIRTAKTHFPKDYSKDLPLLRDGASAGLMRICDIVLQIISHSDGRIDMETLFTFVKAYQKVTHLQLGELWAIPIMIRLALIENIRRISARLAIDRVDGNLADYWAGKMIESVEKDPKNLILIIADMARSNPPMVSAFVSEMTRQLQGKGPDLALPLHWMERQLSESGLTSAELVNAEIQKQAIDQVSMSNSIGSLRLLGAMDWRDFVEAHSIVEQTLREDNGGIYGLMDFSTRDRYRHVVEDIAKKSPLSEYEVARIAIQLMHEDALNNDEDDRTSHVGYYLIGRGVSRTKKLAQMREPRMQRIWRALQKRAVSVYIFFIFLITLAITTGILMIVYQDTSKDWILVPIAFLLLLGTSQFAISVVNFFSTLLVKPNLLPRMDYSRKIPPEFRTLVVIPAMLSSADEIENLAEGLEVRFLANRNDNLHFGLATDFTDSVQETLPEDQALLDLAHQRIEDLNKKYNREKGDLFFLFHRPRHWNPKENTWMGYERKRGKLTDLNSLLRGSSKDSFSLILGDQSIFPEIKYVITLDADTQLPLGIAGKLIGTMAHPLNRPWYNYKKKRVTKGYGILQPRVTVSLPDITGTLYARMHGNEPGIDPYTRASSDVYQDLFGEGSFIGKGIYEIDTFKKVLDGRFPENNILSHDLLEGCYIRSGLLSDVQLFEKYPTTYRAEMNLQQIASNTPGENEWIELFQASLTNSIRMAEERIAAAENLAQQCIELADMEWDFLYDKSSHLLTIGYNVQEHKIDASYYDLLASEVRLCTFIGIAQGKLPEESWFALGRLLTNMHGYPVLLSWSGSMFEYLMPLLVMPTFDNTLLDQTCKAVVKCQTTYRKQAGMPWGISESGFNMINANSQYQYRAFGYPGLGIKRGLEEDTVIAPYASALALIIDPEKACENLELLYEQGYEGRYGFYEAIDYTSSRLQRGQTKAVIYSFMAHHQGMSLLSLAYLLLDKPMQKLFESEPQFKAVLLLLQERIPKASAFFVHTTHIADTNYVPTGTETRIINTPNTSIPEVQLLSNGRYHVMITNAGSGYSRWKDLAVTRWREDGTCDNWGNFCYIRDLQSETYWSNTHQPSLKKGNKYEAAFSLGRADFHTANSDIESYTEIVVSPEDDIEMRRMRVTNRSDIRRTLEITSYAEVVLANAASDLSAPAFSNLFVQTEIVSFQHAILCTRRPRAEEQAPWMFHLMTAHGGDPEEVSYETDRMQFIGRGNTIVNSQAMNHSGPLSGSQGSVLDPIVAIRYKIDLDPDETITIEMVTGVADTKEICLNLIDKYHDKHIKDRVFELSWTHSQVGLAQSNATEADAQLFGHLASSILFTNSSFRADPAILINNHRGQSGLWAYSISGDLPIILLKVEKQTNMHLVKQLVQAHAYWRSKGLAVDLVIWNEEHDGYRQDFQNEILAIIPPEVRDHPGGIFVRASDQIPNEDRILFQTVARINISDNGGTLAEQVKRKPVAKTVIPRIKPAELHKPLLTPVALPNDLIFFNGLGGFSPDGSEYIIISGNKNKTPAPWVNVIANPGFGAIISESGSAYTWTENAHELRLTPWNNDPVSDSGGEAFYLRDEESGRFWSATPLPAGGQSPYITRHGFGYSVFEYSEDGIYSEMSVHVDIESAVKFNVLKIRNQSGRSRKLSATGYIEWVLGNNRMKTAMYIHTETDGDSGALLAKNPYNTEWSNRAAFFDVDYVNKTFTADRTEFIGRNGTLKNPDAMSRVKLSGRVGLALDPCAAIQVPFFMADGEEQEIIFRLGAGKDINDTRTITKQFRGSDAAHESLKKVKDYWKHNISALKVETPDAAINIITNGWLTYQTLSSRLWGRSGYYQSGGAFGFRDQLQDVLSLLHAAPQLARKQILLCAAHQFKEGDVQHWWHPPTGRGVRTRISDDFLWLPLVTSLYILHTADTSLLDEATPFLEGRLLNQGEESYFDLPVQSGSPVKLYDHCVQAIKHGLNYGEHGLPLIGTGDWNDGYNKVGEDGKGESVWMAFFLSYILTQFEKIARLQNDSAFADECIKEALQLKENIDKHAWDGEWYKRAWFDNGTPLGSSENKECKIDSIAQSWSVISGAGDAKRANSAMEAAYKELVQKDAGIIKLLDPPFDKSELNPGYIKGYVPGIRENGGQYTHAAVWMIIAFAKLGDTRRVWELLNMINPINHGKTLETIAIYKVEPYVLAADVYAGEPHAGRGGWTWYTGSAGWLYRLIIESFLGLQQEGDKLKFLPCVPEEWESFKVLYRYKNTVYHIVVTQKNSAEEMMVTVDGVVQGDRIITLADDGVGHNVQVEIFTNQLQKP